MQEPSDGIAEEVERQLQLALAAATIAARRAIAARQHAIEQAHRDSAQHADALNAQIDAERQLAAAHLQPVFDPGWWETAAPRDIADMWQQASSWRDAGRDAATPTIFDHAAGRIRQEVHDRTGLDPTQVLALAAVQDLEHEHHATLTEHDPCPPARKPRSDRARLISYATWLRRSTSPRAAPHSARRRGRARGGDRGADARRPRPSPRGSRSGAHPRRGRTRTAARGRA